MPNLRPCQARQHWQQTLALYTSLGCGVRVSGLGGHRGVPIHPCRFGARKQWTVLPTRLAAG